MAYKYTDIFMELTIGFWDFTIITQKIHIKYILKKHLSIIKYVKQAIQLSGHSEQKAFFKLLIENKASNFLWNSYYCGRKAK